MMTDIMSSYHHLDIFNNVYFEDSFVLGIRFDEFELIFLLELVLLESHARYLAPRKNQQYYYTRAELRFSKIKNTRWFELNFKANSDSENEIDFGNIDSFEFNEDIFILEGDWGRVEVQCDDVELAYL